MLLFRTESLEVALRKKEKEREEEKTKFNKLKEDFKYNLKLLNKHQTELETYDKITSGLYWVGLYSGKE